MHRQQLTPRPDWQKRVEGYGFHFHTLDGEPYWDESACYVFSKFQIDTLERATYSLHEMCLELVQRVIDERMFGLFLIPREFEDLVVRSWEEDEPSVYGRFDLAFNGLDPPKLLEYNADTPTALVESSIVQWYWLQEAFPGDDQWNSIHERLVARWKEIASGLDDGPAHFAWTRDDETGEEVMTIAYMQETAEEAGLRAGDVMVRLEGREIYDLERYKDLYREMVASRRGSLLIEVKRGRLVNFFVIKPTYDATTDSSPAVTGTP